MAQTKKRRCEDVGLLSPEAAALFASAEASLTERERRFIDAFLGTCSGNGTRAARAAGYGAAGARVRACRLLTKANVGAAIAARVDRREHAAIADADERDRLLTAIARDPRGQVRDRIRAIQELNRCSGRHSIHLHHRGRLTLEEALGRVRSKLREKQETRSGA